MIVYSLRCGQGHVFDEWFRNSAEYEDRAGAGALVCPDCGDTSVRKAIMAPSVGGTGAEAPPPAPCGQSACGGGACAFADDF